MSAKRLETKIGANAQKEPFANPTNKQPIIAAGEILYNFLILKSVQLLISGAGDVESATGIAAKVIRIEVIANSSMPFGSYSNTIS